MSEAIRRAVREVREVFGRGKRREREDNDREILAANQAQIERQAEALVAEQAGR